MVGAAVRAPGKAGLASPPGKVRVASAMMVSCARLLLVEGDGGLVLGGAGRRRLIDARSGTSSAPQLASARSPGVGGVSPA